MTESPVHWEPGRLWSLLKVLEINAEAFLRTIGLMGSLSSIGEELSNERVKERNKKFIIGQLKSLKTHIAPIGLFISDRQINTIIQSMQRDNYSFIKMGQDMAELNRRIFDEIGAKTLLCLVPGREVYFSPTDSLFGAQVSQKFPSLLYDIDECGKCFAVERSTASAFHCLRSLEGAIRAISRCLGILDPIKQSDRNWSNALEQINTAIKAKWPTSADRMCAEAQLFEKLYGSLCGMKNPYRNATMHLEQKYTMEEAESVIIMVRQFLKEVANRMDEDGNPSA